jgi:putative cell wall-binding protein
VVFPSSFTIQSFPTIVLVSGFAGSGGATAAASSGVVVITLHGTEGLADSTHATLSIAGITNPVVGTYPASAFSVRTTADTVAVSPAANVVISTASATPLPIQIFGSDAVGTSIAISQQEFPAVGSAAGVVLARDDFYSDALAGGPLAAAVNGPLLVTAGAGQSASLDPRVQAEIQRVLPAGRAVYILGGDLALSANIDTTLESLGYIVIREAGADEYATAVDIANQLAATTWGTPATVFEATGLGFYDALSAVPAAIKEHAAILLTDGAVQAPETAAYLAAHPSDLRYTVGGSLAAGGADPTAFNIAGEDLFNTSAAVASYFFPAPATFGAATAADFPDALGGGVFMATGGRMGPVLLVNPGTPLPPEITPYLASLPLGTQGYVFGGSLAVGPGVVAALQAAIG